MRVTPLLLGLGATLVLGCADVAPAPTESTRPSLVVSGTPDANAHPYVVLLIFDDAEGPAWRCTGSLLSPTLVLTAGHCTDGAVAARVWTSTVVSGNPEYPFGGATSYEGTPYTNPDYCFGCRITPGSFVHRDVGLVVLSEPVPTNVVSSYAQLPSVGTLDALEQKAFVDLVGYGVQTRVVGGGPPGWTGRLVRHYAPAQYVGGEYALQPEFVRLTANAAQDKGGTCFGDSGGPVLIAGTNVVLGVNSYVNNTNCAGVTFSSRVDLAPVLAWIAGYQ